MLDVESEKEVMVFQGHAGMVRSAVFSQDGSHILSVSAYYAGDVYVRDGKAILWQAAGGKPVREIECGPAFMISLSPDGKRVLAGSALWGVAGGAKIRSFETADGRVPRYGTVFSPDGDYALSGGKGPQIYSSALCA